jgi:hypothetical protein
MDEEGRKILAREEKGARPHFAACGGDVGCLVYLVYLVRLVYLVYLVRRTRETRQIRAPDRLPLAKNEGKAASMRPRDGACFAHVAP